MPEQTFFIEGRHLGSCQRYPLTPQKQRPISYAFFCPVCADIWARALIFDTDWFCFHVPCKKHAYAGIKVPGSLYSAGDVDFLQSLPSEVLTRELLLHLDYAESTLL